MSSKYCRYSDNMIVNCQILICFIGLFSNYQVTRIGLWWPDFSELEPPANIICTPKDEKDSTVFSMRVLTLEGNR